MATILRAMSFESGEVMVDAGEKGGSTYCQTNVAHTGSYGIKLYSSGWIHPVMTGTPSNPSISVWLQSSLSGDNSAYDNLSGSAMPRVRFLLDTGEYIEVRFNNTTKCYDLYVDGVKVDSGTVVTPRNTWFHIQFYVTIADSGTAQMKMNGVLDIDYSGDTKPDAGTTGAEKGGVWGGGGSDVSCGFDDLVLGYGGFLGDLRCVEIRPTADTAQDDWTPSAGDNYSTIDEVGASDADYNETNTNGNADELDLGDFDGATYSPVAVTAWVRALMVADTGDSIKVGIDSNGTDDDTELALTTSAAYYFHTADANPDDAAEWEDADIDALKLRYEAVIA